MVQVFGQADEQFSETGQEYVSVKQRAAENKIIRTVTVRCSS